ncbi:electron transport complex subunit RsxD [Pseudoteredinibacter isoporae]|uniref:Ion-translocating oxidoreductase complex subunit D n=1 Tax=Pseudoteredinibacter isoporae TaxID=570281 RepID=A0A7X0JTQ1_9GAMM|nr:electron transport complex subunit RsxD [Pseudoteredinibacter isoporae]MBB6522080.1 electron transport complex protein RnfD [Pseudoteredinibacter isoporae]NHO87615.1 electron transport complex subunit RsxD [Pseudoteredinibacter isoporae]NIB24054.1 electron transport complex subunit RsxD [Pseudoteredinibacter isoporae]
MSFLRASSPHAHGRVDTQSVMRTVILGTLPGLAALTYFFGIGSLINITLALIFCLGAEAAILKLRKRPLGFYLRDYSAAVTAVLLGLALPPYCPWWVVMVASLSAIVLAKQLYGGMGYNPFNPAMVGYVVVLISFPLQMSQWPTPLPLAEQLPSVGAALQQVFSSEGLDAYTSATALDIVKQNNSQLMNQVYADNALLREGALAGAGWEWVNLGFLMGGLYLLYKKVFTWHAPLSMLAALSLCALLGYDSGSSQSGGSLALHLFSGATMLGAFFIITDPVSSTVSTRGRIIFGAAIGVLVYIIRVLGNYPDAVAFAVLLMNFAAPFIDYYTVPRSYGHDKARRATEKQEP